MFGLRYAVATRTKMVGPEKETSLNSLRAVFVEGRVFIASALSSLLDYPENAGCLGAAQIDIAVMMGQIDDSVAFGHGTPLLCPSLQEAAFCGRVDDRTDAYLHLPHWSLSKTKSKQNASEKGDVQGIPGRVSRNPQKIEMAFALNTL